MATNVVTGTATVLSGDSTIAVALNAAHDGSTVMATLQEDDGTTGVASAVWDGSGNLTISLTANATANKVVGYFYVVGQ